MSTEPVETFIEAIEQGDTNRLERVLSEDFRFEHEASPEPMGKSEFVNATKALHRAFPDFRFNIDRLEEEGNIVRGTARITATHKGTLDLPMEEVPTVEPTGRKVKMPEEPASWKIEGDKIVRHHVPAVKGGGIPGMLEQIGATPEQRH